MVLNSAENETAKHEKNIIKFWKLINKGEKKEMLLHFRSFKCTLKNNLIKCWTKYLMKFNKIFQF